MLTKTRLACCVIIICFFNALIAQQDSNAQKYFDQQILKIDQLAKTNQLKSAIAQAELLKDYAFKEFPVPDYNQRKILFKLNFFYRYLNDYDKELATNIELNKLREKELEKENNSFKDAFVNLSKFYNSGRSASDIAKQFMKINKSLNKKIDQTLTSRFSDEKEIFLKTNMQPYFNLFNSFAYNNNYKSSYYNTVILNNTLTIKGALLNASKDILKTLESLENDTISKKAKNYRKVKDFISLQLSLPENKRHDKFTALHERLRGLEQELIFFYSNLKEKEPSKPINWRRIPLEENAIAVEYSRFKYFNKTWTDSTIYIAQVFKKDWGTPKIIPLFEEKQLTELLKNSNASELYNTRGSEGTNLANKDLSKKLYKLIIKPIETLLKDNKSLYISPDGLLHQIAFSALRENKKLLSEKFNIHQYSSTLNIERFKKEPKIDNVLLIGGIDYNYNPNTDISNTGNELASQSAIEGFRNNKSNHGTKQPWAYLKGTEIEVANLETLFMENSKLYKSFTGEDASEENIKAISTNSPSILHIATHGYFFENQTKSSETVFFNDQYKYSDNPLLRSGLVLANGNYAWLNGSNPYEDEDGILTALEISNLNLSQTDLVVLSACETGLGDIQDNEGVYGLQRAFKLAGVKYIIMSLWEVPDMETSEFMTLFYKEWFSSNNLRQAFIKTQRNMHKKYPDDPIKWAGFVLIE